MATARKGVVPNPNLCSATAAVTSEAEVRTTYIVIRWRTCDQLRCRVASRLQCSVTRSWTRSAGGDPEVSGAEATARPGGSAAALGTAGDIGPSSAHMPLAPAERVGFPQVWAFPASRDSRSPKIGSISARDPGPDPVPAACSPDRAGGSLRRCATASGVDVVRELAYGARDRSLPL